MKIKLSRNRLKGGIYGKTKNTALGVQLKEMTDARYGTMYFLGNLRIDQNPAAWSVDVVGTFVGGFDIVLDMKKGLTNLLERTDRGHKLVSALRDIKDKLAEPFHIVMGKIKSMIRSFMQFLIEKFKKCYGTIVFATQEAIDIVMFLLGEFVEGLSSLIPGWSHVQTANDIYCGIRQAFLQGKDFVNQLLAGKGVELLGGHPEIIAKALARHSLKGCLGGVYSVVKTSLKTGLSEAGLVTGGASTLASCLIMVFEQVTKIFDWFFQRLMLAKTIKTAKYEWDTRYNYTSLVNNHNLFSEWLQERVTTQPIIAALLMASGFVAHPYRFLQLLTPSKMLSSQGHFDQGVIYIDKLRETSNDYIKEFMESYSIILASGEGVIQALLNDVINGKKMIGEVVVSSSSPATSAANVNQP